MEKQFINATSAGRVLNIAKRNPDDVFVEKFGQKWLDYRERWANASTNETIEDFPLFVRLESQFKCNSNCALCIHGHEKLKSEIAYDEYMSLNTFKKLVDECVLNNCPSIAISFINEPLMDADFADRLQYVSNSGIMDIHLNSNAQLLTKEMSELIINSNVTRVCFSIDAATEAVFKKMRPNLDYETVVSNINNFIKIRGEKKLPLVRVSFLLNEINAHEQEDFRQKWSEKADYISFQRYVPISIHDEDDLSRAKKEVPVEGGRRCSYPWESLFVHGDGVVVPCAAHRGRYISVGNINKNTLREIWHSDAMNELRAALKSGNLSNTKLCGTCLN